MIPIAIVLTSSCVKRESVAALSVPATRIIGGLPTLMCRSEALASTAMVRRSLTCMGGFRRLPRRGRGPVDERQPAVRVRYFAVDDVEERPLQRFGDRSAPARPDLNLVDRADRRHFGGCADEECLVRDAEQLAGRDALDAGAAEGPGRGP